MFFNYWQGELVHGVSNFIETYELKSELSAVAFSDPQVEKPIAFEELPSSNWSKTGLCPVSTDVSLCTYMLVAFTCKVSFPLKLQHMIGLCSENLWCISSL